MADDNKNEPQNPALADALKNAGFQSEGGEVSQRRPGRPPKTTAGVANTVDTYKPSVERNNTDQALQPSGDGQIAGLGGSDVKDGVQSEVEKNEAEAFGGKGDHDGNGKTGGATRFFPVRLKRNYRPLGDTNWRIIKNDGSHGPAPKSEDGSGVKAPAGSSIALPIDEAKDIIRRGIAERADEIE